MPNILDILAENNENNNKNFVLCPGYDINRPCYRGLAPDKGGDVGIELEIEGNNLPNDALLPGITSSSTKRQWNAINDGSLRNGGREYVTSGPIKVSEIREMVDGLFGVINQVGRIQNSNRCSTHVHVNVSDLKANHITSAIALWTTFQTPFIKWQGVERIVNHFCLSSRDEESMIEAWMDYLTNGRYPDNGYRSHVKYTALNIIPIWTQGSLEFRVGGPPDDPDKVVHWAKICNAIVRYAAENYTNPMDYGYALSEQQPETILRNILEYAKLGPITTDRIYRELTADGNLHHDAMRDFRDIQPILYNIPWYDLMDKINAEFVPNPFGEKKKTKKINIIDEIEELEAQIAVPPAPAPLRGDAW